MGELGRESMNSASDLSHRELAVSQNLARPVSAQERGLF